MTHSQNTTSRTYHQLTLDERGKIELVHAQGDSLDGIAMCLHRSPSTISRELHRGSVDQMDANRQIHSAYFADSAQRKHADMRLNSHAKGLLARCDYFFKVLVLALKQRPRVHSVDSFVHDFKMRFPRLKCPSTPTVYRYIDTGLLPLTNLDLPVKLRRRVKRPGLRHARINKHKLGASIEDRPAVVDGRRGVGHWEGDLVKGKRVDTEPALMTLTERYSRTEIIVKLPNYKAATCLQALQNTIDDYGAKEFNTITFDTGSEFAALSQVKGTKIYFAHPYSPWERGSNENANGLLQEYFPKGKSFKHVTLNEIQAVQSALNHRPRRTLGWLRPCDYYPNMA
ncbi:IS30 family transposase [Lacticaseibacillus suilingensis]|uniref:IS30 family transposase n=1 Tax=Lacticaseibacillus suilingensis TaxID=2799577 RepID=UPI0022DF06F3|nr:IS30 family transposase [Lacticaseibacillus suilingensis]